MFLKVEGNTSKGAIFIYNYSNSDLQACEDIIYSREIKISC
mgnify:CR=1 FL=1